MSKFEINGNNGAFTVSAIVTSVIAGWFLVAAGAIAAAPAPERFNAVASPAREAAVEVTSAARPDTRLAITVVAKRHA